MISAQNLRETSSHCAQWPYKGLSRSCLISSSLLNVCVETNFQQQHFVPVIKPFKFYDKSVPPSGTLFRLWTCSSFTGTIWFLTCCIPVAWGTTGRGMRTESWIFPRLVSPLCPAWAPPQPRGWTNWWWASQSWSWSAEPGIIYHRRHLNIFFLTFSMIVSLIS